MRESLWPRQRHLHFESDDFLFYTTVQNAWYWYRYTFHCIMREFYLEYSGLVLFPPISRSVQHPGEGGLDPGHPRGVPVWRGIGSAQPNNNVLSSWNISINVFLPLIFNCPVGNGIIVSLIKVDSLIIPLRLKHSLMQLSALLIWWRRHTDRWLVDSPEVMINSRKDWRS